MQHFVKLILILIVLACSISLFLMGLYGPPLLDQWGKDTKGILFLPAIGIGVFACFLIHSMFEEK